MDVSLSLHDLIFQFFFILLLVKTLDVQLFILFLCCNKMLKSWLIEHGWTSFDWVRGGNEGALWWKMCENQLGWSLAPKSPIWSTCCETIETDFQKFQVKRCKNFTLSLLIGVKWETLPSWWLRNSFSGTSVRKRRKKQLETLGSGLQTQQVSVHTLYPHSSKSILVSESCVDIDQEKYKRVPDWSFYVNITVLMLAWPLRFHCISLQAR